MVRFPVLDWRRESEGASLNLTQCTVGFEQAVHWAGVRHVPFGENSSQLSRTRQVAVSVILFRRYSGRLKPLGISLLSRYVPPLTRTVVSGMLFTELL